MIWIRGSISPTRKPMVEINASEEDLLVLQNILTHASQSYTHGQTKAAKAYAESVREKAHNWLVMIEGQEDDAKSRIQKVACGECGHTFGHLEGCSRVLNGMKRDALLNGKSVPLGGK